jgi:hypothetical protein
LSWNPQDNLPIDDELLSWSDDNDSLELMSERDKGEEDAVWRMIWMTTYFDPGETTTIKCFVTSRGHHPKVGLIRAMQKVIA